MTCHGGRGVDFPYIDLVVLNGAGNSPSIHRPNPSHRFVRRRGPFSVEPRFTRGTSGEQVSVVQVVGYFEGFLVLKMSRVYLKPHLQKFQGLDFPHLFMLVVSPPTKYSANCANPKLCVGAAAALARSVSPINARLATRHLFCDLSPLIDTYTIRKTRETILSWLSPSG